MGMSTKTTVTFHSSNHNVRIHSREQSSSGQHRDTRERSSSAPLAGDARETRLNVSPGLSGTPRALSLPLARASFPACEVSRQRAHPAPASSPYSGQLLLLHACMQPPTESGKWRFLPRGGVVHRLSPVVLELIAGDGRGMRTVGGVEKKRKSSGCRRCVFQIRRRGKIDREFL